MTAELRSVVWEVFHTLGCGFIFRIYANATSIELQKRGIDREPVRRLQVTHRGQLIGDLPFRYFVVAKRVILLPIAESAITDSYRNKARILLRQQRLQLAMIVNFGNEKLQVNYIRVA
jgi:GxxExxY protein